MMNETSVTTMRPLTLEEIAELERHGCEAEDWSNVLVADDFIPDNIFNTSFYGDVRLGVFDGLIDVEDGFSKHSGIRNATLCDVTVGNNCLIENVSGHICRYDIGQDCYISGVGRIVSDEGSTFGQGNTIAVLNEAGPGNVILYADITSQMAAFMVLYADNEDIWGEIRESVKEKVEATTPQRGKISSGVRLINTRDISNTVIGEGTEVNGASRITECTIVNNVFIGDDVILENSIVQTDAAIVSGAKVSNCLVGEACHIGKGFSAESSVFFANSHMDNGEACAAFCGPFTVSHHKSTLLIGGMYSFYNAGSATNYSNHAYKTGPVHYGVLARGCKTASGAHLLLPAEIGAFSMCMGKIGSHPNTLSMPFSYIIASGRDALLMPGYNLATAGTYRDVNKWRKRDRRSAECRESIVNFEWLSPYVVYYILEGKIILEELLSQSSELMYNGCLISEKHARKGISMYDMALRMFFGNVLKDMAAEGILAPEDNVGVGEWSDLAGFLAPSSEVARLADDIRAGYLGGISDIEARFRQMNASYLSYRWAFTYDILLKYHHLDHLTSDDVESIIADGEAATTQWNNLTELDAEKDNISCIRSLTHNLE